MDLFERSLWFCHQEIDKEAIFMVAGVIIRELSFGGPCRPCFFYYTLVLNVFSNYEVVCLAYFNKSTQASQENLNYHSKQG